MDQVMTLDDGAGHVVILSTAGGSNEILVDLAGWYGGVGVRSEEVARMGDGSFRSRVTRDARKLTVTGVLRRKTGADIESCERMLSGLFPSGMQSGSIRVTGGGEDLWALGVQLDGAPKTASLRDIGRLEFELPLISPDPYLYGDVQRTQVATPGLGAGLVWPPFHNAAGVQTGVMEWGEERPPAPPVVNGGNATAYPVVTVAGNLGSGFVLDLITGGRVVGVTYQASVSPQAPVVVDFAGSVTVNGVDAAWALTRRLWGGVKPGEQATAQLRPVAGGDGTATIELRSTYL